MTKICIVAAGAAAVAVITPASAFAAGWFQMMPVISEANGFVASILVLTTFTMTDMRTLRIVAICSNVAFIAYSALEWLPPVLILHITLLPLNVLRLTELTDRGGTSSECDSISIFRSLWLRSLQTNAALRVSWRRRPIESQRIMVAARLATLINGRFGHLELGALSLRAKVVGWCRRKSLNRVADISA
jgi:hypothetical protein